MKQDGFDGEIRIVVPPLVLKENTQHARFNTYTITDIGYYPKAKDHYVYRPIGSDEYILIHCVGGKGEVVLNNEKYIIEANQYIMIPPHIAHSYEADVLNPWTIYWLHFVGTDASIIAEDLTKRLQQGTNILPFGESLSSTFMRFCQLLSQGYSREILDFIALNLPQFFSAYLYPDLLLENKDSDKDIVNKSISFLKDNVGNRVGLASIAENVHLSVSHFSKLFKARTGYSPIEYLNHLKIQKACYLLQFSDKRVSVISYELGFDDQYYFSRLFKEHMGVSPSHYRNNLIADNNKVH